MNIQRKQELEEKIKSLIFEKDVLNQEIDVLAIRAIKDVGLGARSLIKERMGDISFDRRFSMFEKEA